MSEALSQEDFDALPRAEDIIEGIRERIAIASEATAEEKPRKRWPSVPERLRSLRHRTAKLATGLPKLDEALAGGFMPGRFAVVGGPPGVRKSSLATWLAYSWACQGHPVTYLAADEDAVGICIRIGQMLGSNRRGLEDGDEGSVEYAVKRFDERAIDLQVVDQDEAADPPLFEDAILDLAERQERIGKAGVVVVDSLQTARFAAGIAEDDNRKRIDVAVKACRSAAKQYGFFALGVSEVSRSIYRGGQSSREANPLAAFKESGGVEYNAAFAAVLAPVPGVTFETECVVVKNRQGDKPTLRVAFDPSTATFSEVTLAVIEDPGPEPDATPKTYLDVLDAAGELPGKRGWIDAVRNEGYITGSNARAAVMVDQLIAAGQASLVRVGRKTVVRSADTYARTTADLLDP